jgi:hypothetical protein
MAEWNNFVHTTTRCNKILIIKPTRCTDFSNLFLELNSTCFGQFLCPSSGVFHCTHSNGICHTVFQTACEQDQPTRCTNFSNLFLEWNSTCFGQSLCPSSGVFHCTHSNSICHTVLYTSCSQGVCKSVRHIPLLCVQWRTPDNGQRDCPKQVEFHSKNKFEKLVHLVGFIIRIYHDARHMIVKFVELCSKTRAEIHTAN